MPRRTRYRLFARAFVVWLALLGSAVAQTINGVQAIPAPIQTTDRVFCFRGNAPVYSCSIATMLAGLTTGVFGPATSTSGYVPTWNSTIGNLLGPGLPVSATGGTSTIVETNGSGLITTGILPSSVSLLGNTVTGTGSVVLQGNPTLTNPTVSNGGLLLLSASGSVRLNTSSAGAVVVSVPGTGGTLITTGDIGTVSDAMLAATTGAGAVVLAGSPSITDPTINGYLQFSILPTGTPKTYACFDGTGKLISFWAPC